MICLKSTDFLILGVFLILSKYAFSWDIRYDNSSPRLYQPWLNKTMERQMKLGNDMDFRKMKAILLTKSGESYLQQSSIVYGLTKVVNSTLVNVNCHHEFQHLRKGILAKEAWAMKVLDASGVKQSGFVFGQNFWFGSREGCRAVNKPVTVTLSSRLPHSMHSDLQDGIAPIQMEYRIAYMKHNSPWQVEIKLFAEEIVHVGLCIPKTCSNSDIELLLRLYMQQGLYAENDVYNMQPDIIYMKDLQISPIDMIQRRSLILLAGFMLFTLLMILSAYLMQNKTNTNTSPIYQARSVEGVVVDYLQKFIQCFDIQQNCLKLLANQSRNSKEIPVINGLRSISAIVILIFHVFWFIYFTVNNRPFLVADVETGFFKNFSSAPILVEVFFAISGFLQVYNFLCNKEKLERIRCNNFWLNTKEFFKMLFHRYLRLGPLYVVVLGMVDNLYAYLGKTSVYHITDKFDENCEKYWWRNLLFIQNLFDLNDMCVNWTWSLACDMQFFIISTILLIVYTKNDKLVKRLAIGMIFANIIWSYFIGLKINFDLSVETFFATAKDLYLSSYVRILTYLMGCIAGWYLLERKTAQLQINKFKQQLYWNSALMVIVICAFGSYTRDKSSLNAVSLIVFGRFLFTLAICWIIILSASGCECWWSKILGMPLFKHLNELSYAIYLLNPFVITFIFGQNNSSMHAQPILLCVLSLGIMVIVYILSVVLSLMFEIPFYNLSSLLLGRRKSFNPKLKPI